MSHKTLTNNIVVKIRIDNEVYNANPPFIIGRVEAPGNELDYLAIKTLSGDILYTFKNVRSNWGCDLSKGEYDCVSHNHVKVEAEGNGIRVRHIGRTKTYLVSGQELTMEGVFIDSGSLTLDIPGLKPRKPIELTIITRSIILPPEGERETNQGILCETLCEVYSIVDGYLKLLPGVVTDKDLVDLRRGLERLMGRIGGVENHFRGIQDIGNANVLENLREKLEHIIELIKVAHLDNIDAAELEGRLEEVKGYIEPKCKCK